MAGGNCPFELEMKVRDLREAMEGYFVLELDVVEGG